MDKSTAHDDLALVDRILWTADRTLHLPPLILITWGIVAATINGVHQARVLGFSVPLDQLFPLPLIALGIGITWWVSRQDDAPRETLLDSFTGTTFGVTFAVLFILNVIAQPRVIPVDAMALFWQTGFSIALLIVGLHSSRLLVGAGIAMLAASAIAPFASTWFDGVIAAGWLAGFVAPGILLWSRRANG